jgi:hypothetical protein
MKCPRLAASEVVAAEAEKAGAFGRSAGPDVADVIGTPSISSAHEGERQLSTGDRVAGHELSRGPTHDSEEPTKSAQTRGFA